jgi:hypothetical protein
MDEIRLPQHIVNRIERRWESRLSQTLGDWRHPERAPYHPPLGITIHFDHRKFGGCWRDPCGRRLCSLGNSDRARTVCGARNFPQEVGLPDVFHF